jgi:hypothetical protein
MQKNAAPKKEGGVRSKLFSAVAIVAMVLFIGGCASAKWVPANPNVDSVEVTKARCDYWARHGGQAPWFAAGSPGFVAGAALGHGISRGITVVQDFNDCMIMSGWTKVANQ